VTKSITLKTSKPLISRLHPAVTKASPLEGVKLDLFNRVDDLPPEWDQTHFSENVLITRDFLRAQEAFPPKEMQIAYVLFRKDNRVVGKAVLQLQHNNGENLNLNAERNNDGPGFFPTVGRWFKNKVAHSIDFNTLCCGSLVFTGDYGIDFDSRVFDQEHKSLLIQEALNIGKKYWEDQGVPVALFLVKDIFEEHQDTMEPLRQKHFHEFTIQPNMVMDLHPDWKSYDDYLSAMTSKYRVRARRAAKKAKAVTKRKLTLQEIEDNIETLYRQYRNIAAQAGFNLVNLHPEHFIGLKRYLGEKFEVIGYFEQDRLVGYCTYLLNGREFIAHYLGFEHEENRKYQLYLNMLYDLISHAIQHRAGYITFARTALEIKSSVGAEPVEMYCYMRHVNGMTNHLVDPLLAYLRPKQEEWIPRNPFGKAGEVSDDA